MALIFHERIGLEGRRISPFSWRIRYALAHKGLEPTGGRNPLRRCRAHPRAQRAGPRADHRGRRRRRARQLGDRLPPGGHVPRPPSLFGGADGRGAARLINIWSDTVLAPSMRPQIYADFIWCLDPGDRAYFRRSREAQLGMTLEDYSADRDAALPRFIETCMPLRADPDRAAFPGGRGAGLCRLCRVLRVPVGPRRQPARRAGADRRAGRDQRLARPDGRPVRRPGRPLPALSRNRSGPDGRETQQE